MDRIDIKEIEQEIELELISSMKRNLSRHLKEESKVGFNYPQWQAETLKEFQRFQRENKSIVREKTKGLNAEISNQLKNELKQGSLRELKKYKKIKNDTHIPNDNLSHSFFKLDDKKLASLIDEIQNGTKNANYGALRMMNDQYRKVISKAVMFSNYGAVSPTKAIDMATKDFLNSGINCIEYKDGRRINIADYSDMALRTANTRAQLIGEGQFRQEIGEHLVKPTRHNTSCKKCAKWEGKILIDDVYSGGSKKDGKYPLLSEAMTQGFFHPRCEHSLPTYYKELDEVDFDENGTTENTMKQYQDDLNWINNNLQRCERFIIGSLDEENIYKYKKQKNIFENKKEKVLKIINEPKYINITSEWLKQANPNTHELKEQLYFECKNIKYKVDGKNIILDYSKKEKEVAIWIENTFGGEIFMVPKVNKPSNISTPDYIWKGEKWDLKEIVGKSDRAVDNALKRKKEQANNFILDITKNSLDEKVFIKQIEKIYHTSGREWIDKIILKKNQKVIAIYKRK